MGVLELHPVHAVGGMDSRCALHPAHMVGGGELRGPLHPLHEVDGMDCALHPPDVFWLHPKRGPQLLFASHQVSDSLMAALCLRPRCPAATAWTWASALALSGSPVQGPISQTSVLSQTPGH